MTEQEFRDHLLWRIENRQGVHEILEELAHFLFDEPPAPTTSSVESTVATANASALTESPAPAIPPALPEPLSPSEDPS